ncbi:MAG TPA: cytochrome P450 [Bradyrhizobium sp.]
MPSTSDIATPPEKPSFLSKPEVLEFGARAFAWFSNWSEKPLRIGTKVFVGRHADAVEVLSRDLDFLIGPVNATKIDEVNGPFILGLDRGATLVRERAALYRGLAGVDLQGPLRSQLENDAKSRVAAAGEEIDVVGGYARPIAAMTAQRLFGVSGMDQTLFMDVARALFGHIFLNLNNDEKIRARALRAAPFLKKWLLDEIEKRRTSGDRHPDMMDALIHDPQIPNSDEGNDLIRRTLGGMLVGSIDTTATCVAKIITIIGRDKTLAAGIAADVDNFPRLHGWCWEALRRWPHNPLVLRSAAVDTQLAGVDIRANDQVFVITQAAMLDTSVFPEPQVLNPARPQRPYLHFGGGLHPCAGRDVNAFQIPILVREIVRRGIKSVGTIDWAGPFPDRLPVTFNRMGT